MEGHYSARYITRKINPITHYCEYIIWKKEKRNAVFKIHKKRLNCRYQPFYSIQKHKHTVELSFHRQLKGQKYYFLFPTMLKIRDFFQYFSGRFSFHFLTIHSKITICRKQKTIIHCETCFPLPILLSLDIRRLSQVTWCLKYSEQSERLGYFNYMERLKYLRNPNLSLPSALDIPFSSFGI